VPRARNAADEASNASGDTLLGTPERSVIRSASSVREPMVRSNVVGSLKICGSEDCPRLIAVLPSQIPDSCTTSGLAGSTAPGAVLPTSRASSLVLADSRSTRPSIFSTSPPQPATSAANGNSANN